MKKSEAQYEVSDGYGMEVVSAASELEAIKTFAEKYRGRPPRTWWVCAQQVAEKLKYKCRAVASLPDGTLDFNARLRM